MSAVKIPRDKRLREYSIELRKNATKEENHLWYDFLRNYELHFYRQRVIGEFIADFYCPKARIVIELDGSQHYQDEGITYDKNRAEYMNSLGLVTLRFSNTDIKENFEGVCYSIDRAVKRQKLK